MGQGTSSGKTASNANSGSQGTPLTSAQISSYSKQIDKQGFQKVADHWELTPYAQGIQTMGATITRVGNRYEVETWGTTDVQVEALNNGLQVPMVSTHPTLSAAKTAAKEELKGYLPSVRIRR